MMYAEEPHDLLDLFIQKAKENFNTRVKSIFKIGSLGRHGGFSLCSDVDVALMLDKVIEADYAAISKISSEIKSSNLPFADRLSIFWATYEFEKNCGRFPAYDKLDLIKNGVLLFGTDHRKNVSEPSREEIILESASFILDFLLPNERFLELTTAIANLPQKGARHFTKYILFPVRLLFTLHKPDYIASNHEAVMYFKDYIAPILERSIELQNMVEYAYECRNKPPYLPIFIDNASQFKKNLLCLYLYCISKYEAYVAKQSETYAKLLKQLSEIKTRLHNNILM